MLTDEHLFKIKEKTNWDEERQKWKLPPFQVKKREIAFQKLNNAKQFVQEELEENDIEFDNESIEATPYQNHSRQRLKEQELSNSRSRGIIKTTGSKQYLNSALD